MSTEEFSAFILARQKELNLSVAELSRRSGLSRQSLYRFFESEVEQTRLSTMVKLGIGLELHPLELMRVFFHEWEFPDTTPARAKSAVLHDDVGFIGDVTYPDHSIVTTGQSFTKVWEIQNVGKVPWINRKIICIDDKVEVNVNGTSGFSYGLHALEGNTIDIPVVEPGESLQVSRQFKAPNIACTTISWWKMVDENDDIMFPEMTGLYCLVKVAAL